MPRFHFEVTHDGRRIEDDEGVELADLATMQEEAMRTAGAMVGEQTRFPDGSWAMVVRDHNAKVVATLEFTARSA